MPHGQCRTCCIDKNSSRQQLPPSQPLQETRCLDCYARVSPVELPHSSQESCLQKHKFAPTANRFSVLANLNQQQNQTWAFDFVQTSSNEGRRRWKRAGRHSKLKSANRAPHEAHKSDGDRLGLHTKDATCCVDLEQSTTPATQSLNNTQSGVLQTNIALSAEGVQCPRIPQSRPHSLGTQASLPRLPPTKPVKQEMTEFSQTPKRCLTRATPHLEIPDIKRRESRFFPLSAFLAAPDTVVSHSASPRELTPATKSPARKQFHIVTSSPVQNAASHSLVAPSVAANLRLYNSRPRSPSVVKTSIPITRPITPDPASTSSPSAPMFTPPLTVFPTLMTSPAMSSLPSLAPSRSLSSRSLQSPFTLLPRPQLVPTPVFETPSLAITAPSAPNVVSTSNAPYNSLVQEQLADFLKLGHGNPCWCITHGNWNFPPEPSLESSSEPSKPPVHAQSDAEDDSADMPTHTHHQFVGLGQRMRDGCSETSDSGLELHDVLLTPPSTCSSPTSSFEEVNLFAPSAAKESDTEEEEDWTMLSPGAWYSAAASANNSSTTGSGHESDAEILLDMHGLEMTSPSNSPLTPILSTANTMPFEWPMLQEAMGLTSNLTLTPPCRYRERSSAGSSHSACKSSKQQVLGRKMQRERKEESGESGYKRESEGGSWEKGKAWGGIIDWI